jgi:putative ABC transport system permease protein
VPGVLGRRNAGRNPRRTGITAAALMIGVALVTTCGVVLMSAKASFTKATEDTIHADVFIGADQDSPRPPTFDPAVFAKVEAVSGVQQVLGTYYELARVDGGREYVTAVHNPAALGPVLGVTATAGSVTTLADNQVLVDSDTAANRTLSVGSTVDVVTARGGTKQYTVAGIYSPLKFGYLDGFVLPEAAAAGFAVSQPTSAYIALASGTTVAAALPQVRALLADSPEVDAVDRAAMINQQTGDLDLLLNMVQILLSLAILIAALGIINTLALSVLERTRELGLLRAVGLGRAHTTAMVTVEALVITVFGALLGMGVGVGLGTAVVRAFADDGFSNLSLPWSQLGTYVVAAAALGVIAGLLASIRAARINVLAAIAHE